MNKRASEKISISRDCLKYMEDVLRIILQNENRLTVERAVIDSPLLDNLLVEAIVVKFSKSSGKEYGTILIQASAPLKSESIHLLIKETFKSINKSIPRNGSALGIMKDYVENFLDDFQTNQR